MMAASAAAAAAASASSAAFPFAVSSPYSSRKQHYVLSSSVTVLKPRSPKSHLYISASLPGLGRVPVWSGLKNLGISLRRSTKEAKGRCKRMVVYASLFGVGAPEALVIGVVALLVFGPKGLAEVARNLGKTLRAFQPTLRELQDVSREFKSTLEREIGLDEVQSTLQSPYKSTTPVNEKPQIENRQTVVDQNDVQVNNTSYSSEELLNVTELQLASASQENTYTEEQQKGAVTDQEASADSTNSAESGSTAVDSDNVATQSATPADDPTTVAVTADSNASPTVPETEVALSEIPPVTDASITKQESQTSNEAAT